MIEEMDRTTDRASNAPRRTQGEATAQLLNEALTLGSDEAAGERFLDMCIESLAGLGLSAADISLQRPAMDPSCFVHHDRTSIRQGSIRKLSDEPWIETAWQATQPKVSPVPVVLGQQQGQTRVTVPLAGGGSVSFVTMPLTDEQINVLQPFAAILRLGLESFWTIDKLAQVEDQLSLVLESAQVGIWEWDLKAGTILHAENLDAFLDFEDELAPTRTAFLQQVHADDQVLVAQVLDRTLSMGADYAVEFRLSRADGTVRWVGSQGLVFFDRDGVAQRLIGVLVDVHDRKLLETQVQRSQKLQAVGTLAGGVAHEVNNQLTIIGGVIEMLLGGPTGATSAADQLRLARDATNRTALITRQLLTFSRREVSQPVAIDLGLVVSETEDMLRHLLDDNVVLRASSPDRPVWTLGDRSQIEQVIINLALNARDAMPGGGTISLSVEASVEVATIERLSLAPGNYSRLSVEDTGCGMDEETRSQMFEPFFTTKGLDRGTGLGLSTTLGIVREASGVIEVDSQVGIGTTVHIYLPTLSPDSLPEEPPTKPPEELAPGSGTVLLVEDEAVIRMLFSQTLRQLGYSVLEAVDAESALELMTDAEDTSVDLLITDVVLPGINGRQLADQLSSDGRKMKVLYVSGYTDQALGHDGVLPPETHFLHKPFTAQSLSIKVRAILTD